MSVYFDYRKGNCPLMEIDKMNETKLTPPPWVASMPGCSNGFWFIDKESSKCKTGYIATCYGDNAKNDAHLIAAAPEMYEMLIACSEILKQCDLHNTSRDIDNLLAKARGESND